jgi:threonine/homoserine/homoserine lactone efflux protein
MENFFLKGAIIGFSIAAPVGPIGVLCIRKSLAEGRFAGFITGLGAATADAIYGLIAATGLTVVTNFLITYQSALGIIGGLFLLYLAIITYKAQPNLNSNLDLPSHKSNFFSTLFLTLTNPMTILSFIAIFAGMGLASSDSDYISAILLVSGVFFGSICWWLLLSSGVSFFQKTLDVTKLHFLNKFSAFVIAAFGLLTIIKIIF